MSDNPTKDYKDAVRASLPIGMDYNDGVARYQLNNHSFFTYKTADWYDTYIRKFGYTSQYGILGKEADLAFDFANNKYYTERQKSTFSDAITHSATTNATMVDSDGVLKWRPHNLVVRSEDFGNSAWQKVDTTITPNAAVSPDGTTTADEITHTSTSATFSQDAPIPADTTYTVSVYAKYVDHQWIRLQHDSTASPFGTWFDIQNGVVGTVGANGSNASITNVGNGWYRLQVDAIGSGAVMSFGILLAAGDNNTAETSGTSAYIWGAHLYRSDLGGMVDNPDTGNSYVPTTSAARYLPRRGHHVWNGSAWVNEGVLHESEGRSNLALNSGQIGGTSWLNNWGGGTTMTLNDAVAPDGTTTATKSLQIDGTGDGIYQNFSGLTIDQLYTASCFIKNIDASITQISFRNNSADETSGIVWDGSNVASVNTSGANVVSASYESFGNGWFRLNVVVRVKATTAAFVLTPENGIINSGAGVYFWGAMVEAAPTPSSYIPTSGATATRAADSMTIPAANLPYSATAISIQMDGRVTYADEGSFNTAVGVSWQVDSQNKITSFDLSTNGTETGRVFFSQENADVYDFVAEPAPGSYSPGILVPFNIASRHGSTFINGAVNGTALTANNTPVALPDLSSTDLRLGFNYMGTIRTFRIWADDIGDAGLEQVTA